MQNLRKKMEEIYSHLLIRYYKKLFTQSNKEITNLNAMEISMLEIIYHLQQPTYSELSAFMHISQPNLTYRINNLIEKGYVESIPDEKDKRRHYLKVTSKFLDFYEIDDEYLNQLSWRILEQLSPTEIQVLEKILNITTQEIKRQEEI